MQLEIVRATPADAAEVFGLLYPDHFNNCGFSHMRFSHEHSVNMLSNWLSNVAWLARVDGAIAGFCSMLVGHTFFEDPEAVVEMFYVNKKFRKCGISREFIKRLVADADALGVGNIDATCLSGINGNNDTLWMNLWGKFGFKKLGSIMIRSK